MKSKNSFKLFTATVIASAIAFSIPVSAQEKTKLSDAEIASVAVTANQIDIDYAAIAKQKSKNADVLKFAETMATEVCAISVRSAEISIVLFAPRCTPPIPPVTKIFIPAIEAIRIVAATVVAPYNFLLMT